MTFQTILALHIVSLFIGLIIDDSTDVVEQRILIRTMETLGQPFHSYMSHVVMIKLLLEYPWLDTLLESYNVEEI